MSTTYKKISELTKKTSGLVDADYLTGVDTSNSNQNANFTLSALKSYFQTKLESVFAKIASPTLTGTPKAPTAADRNNTTQIATTAFVQKELAYQAENANTVSKSGDIMSGALKVSTSDTAAQVIAEESTSTASCMLTANASGQAGVYDSGNDKWMISTDSGGDIHMPITAHILYSTRKPATKIGLEYEDTNIPALANWNAVLVLFTVYETSNSFLFIRGEDADHSIVEFPTIGRFRGTIKVDWANNKIRMRCIAAPSDNYINLVHFDSVIGLF